MDIKMSRMQTPLARGVIEFQRSTGLKLMKRSFSYSLFQPPKSRPALQSMGNCQVPPPSLVPVERPGNGQVNAHGPTVQSGGLVSPLLHGADRGGVQQRVDRLQDLDVFDASRGRDDGLQDDDTLHPGLAGRFRIGRLDAVSQ